ncbi:MAG TPA: hypothetical protein DCR55_02480 [Lentisphaeria bacterium]|nr:hypothetical protein [Lentisphaeria bacterium]
MTYRLTLLLILLLILTALVCYAGEPSGKKATIQLKDQTTLIGQVHSVEDGTYKIATKAVGTVTVKEADIESISFSEETVKEVQEKVATNKSALPNISQEKLQAMTGRDTPAIDTMANQILGSAQLMTLMSELMEDPDLLKMMDDPELMKAAQEGDLGKLLASGLIQKLTENQKVQEITRQVVDDEPATE